MGINPMDMKRMVIKETIDSIKSKDKSEKIRNIELLGKTIGIGAKTGLEVQSIKVLRKALKDKDKDVQKVAKNALATINKNQTSVSVSDMLGMFDGGVGFTSEKASAKKRKQSSPLYQTYPLSSSINQPTTKEKSNGKISKIILIVLAILLILCVCGFLFSLGK